MIQEIWLRVWGWYTMSCSFSCWKITGYRSLVNVLRVSKAWVWIMAVKWKVILTQIEGGWGSQPLGATGSPGRGKTLAAGTWEATTKSMTMALGRETWRCFWGWEREMRKKTKLQEEGAYHEKAEIFEKVWRNPGNRILSGACSACGGLEWEGVLWTGPCVHTGMELRSDEHLLHARHRK